MDYTGEIITDRDIEDEIKKKILQLLKKDNLTDKEITLLGILLNSRW